MGRWKPGLGGRFVRNFFKRLEKRRWHWGADLLWVLQCGWIVWLRGIQYTSKNMCRYFRILVFFFEFGVMFLTRTHYQGHISWRQISSRELLPPFPCITWVKASCSRKWFAGECRCDPSSLGGNPDAHLGWLTWVGQRRWRRWISSSSGHPGWKICHHSPLDVVANGDKVIGPTHENARAPGIIYAR